MNHNNYHPPEGFVEDFLFSEQRDTPRWLKKHRKFEHQRKHVAFVDLDRKTRRSKAVSLRWRIRSDPNGAGVFTSHDILPGSREWPGEPPGTWAPHAWADFYFMSRKPISQGIFYNAFAKTALERAALEIEEAAAKAIEELMTEEDRQATRLRSFSKPMADGGSTMIFAPDVGAESLGGLTRQGAQAQWLRDRWNNLGELVEIHPEAVIDLEYTYGIGLHLIVPEVSVDTRTIPGIIERFLDRGEIAYQDGPFDLNQHMSLLEKRLKATLWRWDRRQADVEGKEMPEPDKELWPFFDTHSNALRM